MVTKQIDGIAFEIESPAHWFVRGLKLEIIGKGQSDWHIASPHRVLTHTFATRDEAVAAVIAGLRSVR